jgi:cell division protein ZapA
VRELVGTVGQAGDSRLLLMAGLVVCDELSEALAQVEESEKEVAALKAQVRKGISGNEEKALADMLDEASTRIETIAARIAHP